MKDVLRKMFNGWILHENSYDPVAEKYGLTKEAAMIEACDGDVNTGYLIYLFDYWMNDIQSVAPHFGMFLDRGPDGKLFINEDIPAAPSPLHYWNKGKWNAPEIADMCDDHRTG